MKWRVPLTDVTVGEEEASAAAEVIRSGWLSQGARVETFEQEFARAVGSSHAVAVSNGTAALFLSYGAAGLREGDEFILPALTFVATLNAGLHLGARPVLADCASPDDLTLSAEDVARKITPRTRLIVTMPYGGFCPDMPALMEPTPDRRIPVVEDACHAPLATLGGRCMGTFGKAGAFSFFANKNMTTGEGGMIVTDDEELASRVRLLRSHGMTTQTWDRHRGHAAEYDVAEPGYNCRLDEVRAAIGIAQLRKLGDANARRSAAATQLRQALEALEIPNLAVPFSRPRGRPVHHLFVILLPPETDRRRFRAKMTEQGVQTSVHYPPLHRLGMARRIFREREGLKLPVVESIESRLVSLPMGPHLDESAVAQIADSVKKAIVSL